MARLVLIILCALLILGCAFLRDYVPSKNLRSIFTGEKVKPPPKALVN
jgi:hypothetical protein